MATQGGPRTCFAIARMSANGSGRPSRRCGASRRFQASISSTRQAEAPWLKLSTHETKSERLTPALPWMLLSIAACQQRHGSGRKVGGATFKTKAPYF